MVKLIKHPVFWFQDGSIVLKVEDNLFKVHETLLSRHSPFLAEKILSLESSPRDEGKFCLIDPNRQVLAKDFEVLLEHFYHDAPLFSETSYTRIASVFRVSSPNQLHFPSVHSLALTRLQTIMTSTSTHVDDANAACARKFRYYNLVISETDFDMESAEYSPSTVIRDQPKTNANPLDETSSLSPADSQLCATLMNHLIEYFTPILFTPPAASHMACTDAFAETWMTHVISRALEIGGVYKPLETLEWIKEVEWGKEGVCANCMNDKREEWTAEQRSIWRAMDEWLAVIEVEP